MNQLTSVRPRRATLNLVSASGATVWFKKDYWQSSFDTDTLRQFAAINWDATKMVLKHRNCPEDLREHYAQSPRWYERLVAMLAAPARATHWRRALGDSKSTVRAAAVRAALHEEYIPDEQLNRLIMNDEAIHGYFRDDELQQAMLQADRAASESFDALVARVVAGEISSKDVGAALGLPGKPVSRLILEESRAGRSLRWIEQVALFCEAYNADEAGLTPVDKANRLTALAAFVQGSDDAKAALHLLWQAGALKKVGRMLRLIAPSRLQAILAGTGGLDLIYPARKTPSFRAEI